MAQMTDIAEMDPVLELNFGPGSLRCVGTLSGQTRRHVLEAVEFLLTDKPARVGIDVSHLNVVDVEGANALSLAQRMAKEAGATLLWHGLDSERLGDGSGGGSMTPG